MNVGRQTVPLSFLTNHVLTQEWIKAEYDPLPFSGVLHVFLFAA